MRRHDVRLFTVATAAALVLGAASTLWLAAAGGAFHSPTPPATPSPGTGCSAPALPGTAVNVTLIDMAGMMRRPHQPRPMMGTDHQPNTGMMRIFAAPRHVPQGTVSLRASNTGALTHELTVLPLPTGQGVGQRLVGADGKIDETGSLGEASRTCGAGSGDGIAAGATGWTTLTLGPGRYELVCNLPGHYASGMYTELDVTR